jgi:hypothetical protein
MLYHQETLHCDNDTVTLRRRHKPLALCHCTLSVPWLQQWSTRRASRVVNTSILIKFLSGAWKRDEVLKYVASLQLHEGHWGLLVQTALLGWGQMRSKQPGALIPSGCFQVSRSR